MDRLSPYADGYERFFTAEIEPSLAEMEKKRREVARKIKRSLVLALVAFVLFLACLVPPWFGAAFSAGMEPYRGGGMMAGLFVSAVFLFRAGYLTIGVQGDFKEVVVGRTCTFLGLDYARSSSDFPVDRFRETGLCSGFDDSTIEDAISGEHKGVALQLCQASLERRGGSSDSGSSTSTAFKGVLLIYRFPKRFHGATVVLPDATWAGNLVVGLRQEGQRVTLEDVGFEDRFEVYSSDQVEARYLLTPRFMERVVALGRMFDEDGGGLSMAFDGSDLLIAYRTPLKLFVGAGVFTDFTDRAHIGPILKELAMLLEIVDVLKLDDRSGSA